MPIFNKMKQEELEAHIYYVLDKCKLKDFLEDMRMAYVPDMDMINTINTFPVAMDFAVTRGIVSPKWASSYINHLVGERVTYEVFHHALLKIKEEGQGWPFAKTATDVTKFIVDMYEQTKHQYELEPRKLHGQSTLALPGEESPGGNSTDTSSEARSDEHSS